MDTELLEKTAKTLTQPGRGILAADESNPSAKKRFDAVNIKCSPLNRRKYRELLFTSPKLHDYLSGVILFEETFSQATKKISFPHYLAKRKIIPGIKLDAGLIDLSGFPGEKVTKGLDILPELVASYAQFGAKFAKWRAVIKIGEGIPTDECIGANTLALARYARICQDSDIVPIVEPEVLFEGTHTPDQCEYVMGHVFDILFATMRAFKVYLPGAILKTSMVLPGKDSGIPINPEEVADRTCRVLYAHVPRELGGIVFLSGGQTPKDALINLNRIARRGPHQWGITFSYSRALQDPVLHSWGIDKDRDKAQKIFLQQLAHAVQASLGKLDESELIDNDFVSHSQDL